ncbi:hypothetical protein NA57DRAFT_33700 [Rhizodiscina lignyota]|uniref:Pentatricopeptide repeat-containing protein-mitochondrial domain-containing protein n=1 Tax=Rhizodiscina lignyota TaxID=1504668 RepID=A0A9P4IJA8_9PEZI|nr:hypothetical protein NA57DRAFT_33700 [Rhizodiscina lignyota]
MLESNTNDTIYHRMRFAARRGEVISVHRIAAFLVKERKEPLNLRLYANLILSHVSAPAGSALWVAAYLKELREEGLEADSALCHDVLKVLSVHPHFVLRNEVLDYMRSKWYTLSVDGHHDVIAGNLREGQLEMALEMLSSLRNSGAEIKPWLYDMTLHMLCDAGEFEQAMRVMQTRVSATEQNISATIWWTLLDLASEALHRECTNFVWKRRVIPGYLNPSSGICLNALKIAARHGDPELATDVFRVLGHRHAVFEHEHYELLLAAYMKSGDLESALTVLCVMHDAGTPPDMGTARPIVFYLQADPARREKAFKLMQSLKDERVVPPVAMNTLIESALWGKDLPKAIEYYKKFDEICEVGRDIDTYNTLFRGLRSGKDKAVAMFLVSEMVAFKIKPNTLTYDRLVLVCVRERDFEDAFRYYFEMLAQGHKPRVGTVFALAKKALTTVDVRTPKLIEDLAEYGDDARKVAATLQKRYEAARAREGERIEEDYE